MRAAPGTVGRPPTGTTIKLFDDDGKEVPHGESGRIFVGSSMQFEGYTGGGSKETIEGMMSTGDVGHFDDDGRLFVDGRDDDMIVSGGENVFPAEVEDLLSGHEGVTEAAVVGVDDEKYGKRLRAYVVAADGSSVRGRAQGLREVQPRPLQGAARDHVHRRDAPQPGRQGHEAQAAGPRR